MSRRRAPVFLGISALAVAVAAGQDESPLRPGEGRELVALVCTSCHTADLIISARMSRRSWDTTITWMQETQGLGPLSPDVRATILDYLEAVQGPPDGPNDPNGPNGPNDEDERALAESPWAYPLYRPNPIW